MHIGAGLFERLADLARSSGLAGRVALVTDSNVLPLYGDRARQLLSEAGFTVALYEMAAGEDSKSLDRVAELYDRFLRDELDRTSGVIALGGGVVGDVAGFVAATALRGLRVLQCPTTLLAAVDSAVGGKTGVDHAVGKNL
ncbi:MAG: iron-containing alcohol dehydrogenase, partial [Candidatus Hydrogenedentes bacterium]|nr:iron-containing alcohol dehydrogenase [Candidatus Hydrogenedentota bacterium]